MGSAVEGSVVITEK